MKSSHSTQFLINWILVGLLFGIILILIGSPKNTQQQVSVDSYANAVSKASASVVSIKSYYLSQPSDSSFPLQAQNSNQPEFKVRPNKGSGVIISSTGYIVTNHHVVAGAKKIEVTFNNGQTLEAEVLGLDPDSDIAVITTRLDNLPPLPIANSNEIRVGDIVLAIGNPFGIGQTVTQGIISATGRDRVGLNTYENFIQTDAAINPGNSGGALINSKGEILGINSAIYSQSGNYLGISFAIPINLVLDVVQQIIKNGEVVRGWLGVEGVDLNAQMLKHVGLTDIQGVLITDVFDQGPADIAGIKVGDILTHINKKMIRDTRDVLDAVAHGQPGDKIKINGIRERQSFTSQAILGQRPKS
jgi:serine peptidase DegS